MNFYKHHIGDYAQATAHLSFVEDAAYSRLIRKYYAEEKPLPAELKAVQRLVGARTKEEKQAVADILEEFFYLEADGWHNKRCDAEIARASAQADTNRLIAIEREAQRKARNSSKQPNTNRPLFEHESLHESCSIREPSQTPDSRHQTPIKNGVASERSYSATHSAGESDVPPDGGALADHPQDSESARTASLTQPMVRAGIRANPGHPDVIALAKAGCTPDTVQSAIDEARRVKGDAGSITQGYVMAILKRWQSEPPVAQQRGDWVRRAGLASAFGKGAMREGYLASAAEAGERLGFDEKPQPIERDITPLASRVFDDDGGG